MSFIARVAAWLASLCHFWPIARQRWRWESILRYVAFECYLSDSRFNEALAQGTLYRKLMIRDDVPIADQFACHAMCADMGAVLALHGHRDTGMEMLDDARKWMLDRDWPADKISVGALMNLGIALLRAEREAESVQWMEAIHPVITGCSDLPQQNRGAYHDMLGLGYQKLAQWAQAEQELRNALEWHFKDGGEKSRGYIGTLNNLAETLTLAGRPAEARPEAQRAVALAQKWDSVVMPTCLDTLASVYEAQGEWEPASLARDKALSSLEKQGPTPDLAQFLERQAALLGKMGRKGDAKSHTEAAERVRRSLYHQTASAAR